MFLWKGLQPRTIALALAGKGPAARASAPHGVASPPAPAQASVTPVKGAGRRAARKKTPGVSG
jgi:hypothetical protein